MLLKPDLIIQEYQQRLEPYMSESPDQAAISRKKQEAKRYQTEGTRLIDLFQTGLLEQKEVENRLKQISSGLDRLQHEIVYLEKQEEQSKKMLTVIENLEKFTVTIGENLESETFEEKRAILELLIEEVEVDTINNKINLKHILPLKNTGCRLHSERK